MLTLYFSKGSSAIAPHILLEEIGADYELAEVSIPQGTHQTPEFLALNPKGRVPVLVTPQGVLTENTVILPYLAQAFPGSGLAPTDPFAFAKAQEFCAYFASTVHVAFAHKQRGARWADDADAHQAMQAKVPQNMSDCANMIETHLLVGPWALGDSYTFVDPYLLLIERWLGMAGVDVTGWPKLAAHADEMRGRPATQAVLAANDLA
jgi:glutathione S-transferase